MKKLPILFAILIVALLVVAPLGQKTYIIYVLCSWLMFSIAAMGLNLTLGYAGQVSLAQASFVGIGAYITSLITLAGYHWVLGWLAAMGATAFQKGLGAIHALSHPIGAIYHTHHGTTNAVVMPMVLDFNRAEIEDRIIRAAAYLGIAGGFDGFKARILALRTELSIPENLTAMGVDPARLDELTEMALEDPSCGGNPVEMTRENTRALFAACM